MIKGVCVKCGKKVGGVLHGTAYKCGNCMKIYCKECRNQLTKIGIGKCACPHCGGVVHKYR